MWSEGWYDYRRLPGKQAQGWYDCKRLPGRQAPHWNHPSDGNHRLINVPKRPPLGDKRPSLLARPDEGGYGRYYCQVDYQEWDEGRCFSQNPKSGPPYKRGPYGYRWSRDEYATSRQPEYRAMRNGFRRRRFYSSHYSRQRSPHERGAPFLRESRVGGKDSLPSRFGSSVSSRSRMRSFHQSRLRCRERAIQFLKTSRDTVPSSSSSKVLKSPRRLTEKEEADAASKWANENPKKSEENNLAEISEFETGSKAPLCINQTEEPESNTTAGPKGSKAPLCINQTEEPESNTTAGPKGSKAPLCINQTEEPESNTTAGPELCEDSQFSSRSKAIASKITEIEKVYRQVCETFGMVVERLVEKDRSLEKPIQFAMKQSLHEIGEQHVEELKHFIMEYDNSTPDFGDPF
ncbi:periphilin-1-like [Peromyscus californicus insignis]|uniref:periphilin-1-like n=1 Tax=Peromyscus californicus insignis TaxID=564181 RepID=UPI0022A78288|nr:periphilin-1-like [Peromyscus californicus insignis]XP_052602661.1 periphilin-1-like [Peromyscus californicus insignis]